MTLNAISLVGSVGPQQLRARRIGIDTQHEAVVFMHKECSVCRSEGFTAHTRVLLRARENHVVATLYQVASDLISHDEAGLSESAWARLGLQDGELVTVSHPDAVDSMSHVRSRIYGQKLGGTALRSIIGDIVDGRYSDIQLSSFITACATRPLDGREILALTRAMVDVGDRLSWNSRIVVDKHSIGGLPGNRTTPIIVPIIAALGMTMPKTSSRAITSPAGTADTMETMAPVDLDIADIHRVVEREGGCVVWGGAVKLSPADDIIIRIERALDIDTEGQMIASVLSKKIAAGSTRLVLDLPVGATAKVRSQEAAEILSQGLRSVAEAFDRNAAVPGWRGLPEARDQSGGPQCCCGLHARSAKRQTAVPHFRGCNRTGAQGIEGRPCISLPRLHAPGPAVQSGRSGNVTPGRPPPV
jgi:thymidine phosphorylase